MTIAAISPGSIVNGRYRIERAIARGGMGVVYEASASGQRYAVKVMDARFVSDLGFRERFDQEVRIGSQLTSPYVVRVFDHGIDEASELPYLVMELLDGEPLSEVVARRGRLSADEAKATLAQACDALREAHGKGIVHRDVKPQNLFRTRAGVVKVLDFGLAKVVSEWLSTANSIAFGSPGWTAPEQFDTRAPITAATDVWSLGLLAFYLLTGKQYWVAANDAPVNPMLVSKELYSDPIEPASQRARKLQSEGAIPEGFDQWFAGCVERQVSARYPNAWSAYQALEAALAPTRFRMVKPSHGIRADISESRIPLRKLTGDTGPQAPSSGARSDDELVAQAAAELRARIALAIQVVPSSLDVAQAPTRSLPSASVSLTATPLPRSAPAPASASSVSASLSAPAPSTSVSAGLPAPLPSSSATIGLPPLHAAATQPMSLTDRATVIMASAPAPDSPASPTAPIASSRKRRALVLGAGLSAAVLLGGAILVNALGRSNDRSAATLEANHDEPPPIPILPSGAMATASPPVNTLTLTPADEAPPPPASVAPAAASVVAPAPLQRPPVANCPSKKGAHPGAGCPEPAGSSSSPTRDPPPASGPFPRDEAQAALTMMSSAVSACHQPDEPTSVRRVEVTFAPSGRVSNVSLDENYHGAAAPCIRGAFSMITVRPFQGEPETVTKRFVF